MEPNFEIFPKGSFSLKNLIFGVSWGYTCGAHVAALVFRPTENLSIVPYSRRGRDACISSVFFRM